MTGREHRRDTAAVPLIWGQGCFLAMMACCLAIRPSALAVKRGLSYYGTHVETVIPYSVGFVLCVSLTGLAVARMRADSSPLRCLRLGLVGILALLAAIPLTPYNLDLVFDWLHLGFTTALFSLALVVGLWIGVRLPGDRLVRGLLCAQAAGGALVLASQVGVLDLMIPSQFLFQGAFGLLVVRALRLLAQVVE
jgi:heme/copper-type cytochrome/quinol oxidase subunit 4